MPTIKNLSTVALYQFAGEIGDAVSVNQVLPKGTTRIRG